MKLYELLALYCICAGAHSVHARTLTQTPAPLDLGVCQAASLTPELTEGPYYVEDVMFRNNIKEDQNGLPFTLRVAVVDADCVPLVDVFVDVWHANANGLYSGFTGVAGQDNTTFLRGVTLTDEEGIAEFKTIFPGWYTGRAAHIHVKVHVPDNTTQLVEQQEFEDSHTAHTGQLFFSDYWTNNMFRNVQPYAWRLRKSNETWMTLAEDAIYASGGRSQLVNVYVVQPEVGLFGDVTIKVEETASPALVGSGMDLAPGMGSQRVPGPMPTTSETSTLG